MSLKGLNSRLQDIRDYLDKVASGKLPVNHTIIYELQDVFNLLPNLNIEEFVRSLTVKTNDQMLVVYVASLIRAVIALHNLINNKVANRDAEKDEAGKKENKDKDKDKDKDTKEKGESEDKDNQRDKAKAEGSKK